MLHEVVHFLFFSYCRGGQTLEQVPKSLWDVHAYRESKLNWTQAWRTCSEQGVKPDMSRGPCQPFTYYEHPQDIKTTLFKAQVFSSLKLLKCV